MPGARAPGPGRRLCAGPRGFRTEHHRRSRSAAGVRVPGGDETTRRTTGTLSMKYLDEYRDTEAACRLSSAIARTLTRPWTIMEVCGGQTHTIVKYGLDRILPAGLELV